MPALKRRLIKRSIPVEHTMGPVHPKSHAAGFTTPTDSRYRPGRVVIMGSHWRTGTSREGGQRCVTET